MFTYICLALTIQIHQLSLSKPDRFAFKTNINRNLFVRCLKNYDFTFIVFWHCCTSLYFIKRRGMLSPRSNRLRRFPLPLLRAQAPPATPAIISTFLIVIYFLTLLYSDYIFEPTIEQ